MPRSATCNNGSSRRRFAPPLNRKVEQGRFSRPLSLAAPAAVHLDTPALPTQLSFRPPLGQLQPKRLIPHSAMVAVARATFFSLARYRKYWRRCSSAEFARTAVVILSQLKNGPHIHIARKKRLEGIDNCHVTEYS